MDNLASTPWDGLITGIHLATLAGDSGYGVKAEAAWRPQALPNPVRGSEVYVFGDTGEVRVKRGEGR